MVTVPFYLHCCVPFAGILCGSSLCLSVTETGLSFSCFAISLSCFARISGAIKQVESYSLFSFSLESLYPIRMICFLNVS